MKTTMNRKSLLLSTLAVLSLIGASEQKALAAWPDHVDTAAQYVLDIDAVNNNYASPSFITYSGGTLYADTVCGTFATLLIKNSYSTVTDSVIKGLTTSTSPNAKKWNDSIDAQTSYMSGSSTWNLKKRATVGAIDDGDILASEYTVDNISGHVMIVKSITLDASNITPSSTIPNVTTVDRYLVEIYDSTSTVHGDYSGSTDSRYLTDEKVVNGNTVATNDKGLGEGEIYLFANHANGELVGWTWNTTQTTIYQGTDSTAAEYRPITAGYMTGPGL